MSGETYSQEVDLNSNEVYGVKGEVQVITINGTTDAVCYSVINSPGQQSGVTKTNRTENCTTTRAIGSDNYTRFI